MTPASKFFSKEELQCHHCGVMGFSESFLDQLDTLRLAYGHPMLVTSGYRCPNHPVEAIKGGNSGGAHTRGAVDIGIFGPLALELIEHALELNWTGIGINQRGLQSSRFIHLDREPTRIEAPRPWCWSY